VTCDALWLPFWPSPMTELQQRYWINLFQVKYFLFETTVQRCNSFTSFLAVRKLFASNYFSLYICELVWWYLLPVVTSLWPTYAYRKWFFRISFFRLKKTLKKYIERKKVLKNCRKFLHFRCKFCSFIWDPSYLVWTIRQRLPNDH